MENFDVVDNEIVQDKAQNEEKGTPLMVTAAAVVVGGAVMYAGFLIGSRFSRRIKKSGTKVIDWLKGDENPTELK